MLVFQFLKIPIIIFLVSAAVGATGAVLKATKNAFADNVIVTALWLFIIALAWAIILLMYAGRGNNK